MSETPVFTQQDIEVLHEETLYRGFFELKRVQFRHKLFAGGMSGIVTRELLIKGAASAVVAYDPQADAVVLVEQVRIGAYNPALPNSPWLLELIAGMVEEGESPESVAVRESEEEAGVKVSRLEHALSVWDSPGGVLERIHLFVGQVDSATCFFSVFSMLIPGNIILLPSYSLNLIELNLSLYILTKSSRLCLS